MQGYEKLGTFYLGQSYDLEQSARRDDLIRIHFVGLGWAPHIRDAQGRLVPAWL